MLCNKTVESVHDFTSTSADHYGKIKSKTNKLVDGLLPTARDFINKGETPRERFNRACYLASAGNVAPIGAPSGAFKFDEVETILKGRNPVPLLIGDVYEAALGAANIFYVADNAGEIGFDSLLVAMLKEMGSEVTLIVKGPPFFEDATLEDASFFGLDKLADHILTVKGVFVPSECAQPVADAFARSDLVISKGTGNYEALKGELEGKATIYMLKVKCSPVCENMGKEVGNFIVKLEK
jgi:uncharacterized protein with ATP-grasp and redox domains